MSHFCPPWQIVLFTLLIIENPLTTVISLCSEGDTGGCGEGFIIDFFFPLLLTVAKGKI